MRRALLSFSLLAAAAAAQGVPAPKLAVHWDRFYDTGELETLIDRMVATWPKMLAKVALGQSSEGRTLWAVVVNNPDTGSDRDKPAFYSDANIHGNEVQGAETNLYLVWYLMESYGRLPRITKLVDRVAFYVVPTVNPDGRAHWFEDANSPSSQRSGVMPVDDDGDGVADEDPPNDLDGDGNITMMRKRVPLGEGSFREVPDHPGLMERVSGETKGDLILLGSEGIDDDGDGEINEDGPGYYDLNRNWPALWAPRYVQGGAGDYPLSQPEARAVADFVLAHPNIAGVQAFHNAGGMILRGPGTAEYGGYPREDDRVYDELGKEGEFMLPFYRYMVIYKDLYTVWGGFVNWTYEGLGIFSFTNEMWNGDRRMQKDERLSNVDERKWDDLLTSGADYVPWHEVEHPLYGTIEVGGPVKRSDRVPPTWLMEEGLHRNASFVLRHAEQMPEVTLEAPVVREAPGGAHYVDVVVRNARLIPTRSALAAQRRMGLPDTLEIAGDGIEVLAGGEPRDRFDLTKIDLQEHTPAVLRGERGVPSYGTWKVRWIVRGAGPFEVRYHAEKANDQVQRGAL